MKIGRDVKDVAMKLMGKQFPGIQVRTIKPIHAGYTNFSYYVELTDNSHWQVRIPHDGNLINREVEAGVLKAIKNTDFVYFDPKTGIAIKKWINAKNPRRAVYKTVGFNEKLFAKIKHIHQTTVPASLKVKPLNFDAYNKNLYRLKFIYQKKFLCILDRHRDDILVLNHTDINPKNILVSKSGEVHLIDYEWAGLANDYFDYANYIREAKINYKKIDWSKYIPNFDMKKLNENIYIASVYAYLWTFAMPQSAKILKYRKQTYKQIKKSYRSVINYGNDTIKPL